MRARDEDVEVSLPEPYLAGDVFELEPPRLDEREVVVGPAAIAWLAAG